MSSALSDLDMPDFQAEGRAVTTRVSTPLLGRQAKELDCVEIDGALYFEGDIHVYPALPDISDFLHEDQHAIVLHGHGIGNVHSLWSGGIIPCAFHHKVAELAQAAIAYWMNYTPLQFTVYSGEPAFLAFMPASVNESPVGRQGGRQIVGLIPGTTLGWAIHEIGHAIGLWHEHSRADQNQHIYIHWENIRQGNEAQFRPLFQNALLLGPYDYDSAMHYSEDAFASEGQLSISRLDGGPLGPRSGLSIGDIAACKKLYPNLNWG